MERPNDAQSRPESQAARGITQAGHKVEADLADAREQLEQRTRELAQSLSMTRATLDSSKDGIIAVDDHGVIWNHNEKLVRMWNLPRETVASGRHSDILEHIGRHFAQPAEYLRRVREIEEKSPPETFDILRPADGRVVERYSRIQTMDDRPAGRVWIFRDVTSHQRVENEVHEQREWFRVTLSSIGDAVITANTQGKVNYLNLAAEKVTGWKLTDAMGRPLEEVFRIINEDTRERAINPVDQALREGIVVGLANHTALISRDGLEIPIEDSAAPIRDASGNISGAVIVFHDVTERRRAERALRQSRERLEAALAAASTGTFRWTVDSDLFEGDENLDRLLGLAEEEKVPSLAAFVERVDPEHRERVAEAFKTSARTAGNLEVEFRLALADGSIRWLHCRGMSYDARPGSTKYFTGACVDVTERKRAEEARFHLAALVESSDDAIISKDLRGVVRSWNHGAERIFGYVADEIVGQSITLLIPPDRFEEERDILEKLSRGERIEAYETVRIRKDGRVIDVSLTVSPVRDSLGQIIGASKIARDVTARKRTEAALREEYGITEALNDVAKSLATELEADSIAKIVTEAGRRITRADFGAYYQVVAGGNTKLHTICGFSREMLEELPLPDPPSIYSSQFWRRPVARIDDLTTHEQFRNRVLSSASLAQFPVRSLMTVPLIARTNEIVGWLLFGHSEAGAFTYRDERIMLGISSQAAAAMESARLYEAEQQARNAAEQASKAKDLFLAALSHELRTPLTPALAILSSLCQDTSVPERVVHDLETVRRNVELEARLIDDLLDVTRITHGKLELQCGRVPLERLLDDVIATCQPDLEAKQFTLVREVPEPGLTIYADAARITQILWNLVRNAIKFTPAGGTITIRSRRVQDDASEPKMVVEVEDTGIGIEPSRIEKLFEAFEQGDREITRQFGGLGLGLAISRAIAGFHRGTLVARSEGKGKGSTFILTLPLSGPGDEGQETPIRHAPGSVADPGVGPAPPALRLLLVEDHADSAAALSSLLRKRGFVVTIASGVAQALAAAGSERFDVVMSDLGLPDGTGYELMKHLHEEHGIPGIALSGFGMEEDVRRCREAGFTEHLIKPVRIAQLEQALARIVGKR